MKYCYDKHLKNIAMIDKDVAWGCYHHCGKPIKI